MNRVTSKDVTDAVTRINKRFGIKLDVDWQMNKARVLAPLQQRYMSPRGSNREIMTWLSGFEEAMDFISPALERE